MLQNPFFPEIHGNFGFGCMRLPMKDGSVDHEQFCEMTDAFLAAGFNYFDTAHGYIGGKSETAIAAAVSARHKRSEFLLTNKLSDSYFKTNADIRPFFETQLKACGVDYFDFYLMHAQNRNNYAQYQNARAYEEALKMKEEGLLRHLGISFHDKADVLDRILSEHPEVEIVQIQFNYLDYEDPGVEGRKVYEVCEKHAKPVIVMEPVKGGRLANLPDEAAKILSSLGGGSNASYAVRFAASFAQMAMVISGMSDNVQMADNLAAMRDFKPVTEEELAALGRVCAVFRGMDLIPCTACRYCVEQNKCPKDIRIPDIFAARNAYETFHSFTTAMHYRDTLTADGHGKASDCIRCGRCEKVCPQHLAIRDLLADTAAVFEK